jgi:predicted kinase
MGEVPVDPWPSYVVVSGAPGSGKTTLARQLAAALRRPLIAKDTIKEALMTVLDVPDVETSRVIGRAAVVALRAVAAESTGAVLESAWHRSAARVELATLPGSIVEVFCRCDRQVAEARYTARASGRVPGHFDRDRSAAEIWNDDVSEPVAGGWPVIEVDTNQQVDVDAVVDSIRRAGHRSTIEGRPVGP